MLTNTEYSKYAALQSMPQESVQLTDGFWKTVVTNCSANMVPQLQKMFEDKDISHVLENFRICAGETAGSFSGTVFGDGDFYKWMEAKLYSAEYGDKESILAEINKYIDLIARSQQPDGYLSTKQIIEQREGKDSRLKDVNEFEIYNMGHLFTSACLHYRVTGDSRFLAVAEKAADYLGHMYAEAEKNGDVQTAVCPSHYMGLIELYRTTNDEKYLHLCKKAIELRDIVRQGMDDNQDRIPLKQHDKIIGHAVRAAYLYAGVADLYLEDGDDDYLTVLRNVWRNLVDKKLYITGGIGALYNGVSPYGNFFIDQKTHQAFGYEYQLPNITAYCETCASVGLVMWAYRMFLIDPRVEYMDVLERALLNVNLAAVSFDGKKYFYENMLRRTKQLDFELVWPLTRTEYILSYCCPPNLARLIMQSKEYLYATKENAIYCGIYGANRTRFSLANGSAFTLHQDTEYPYDGRIRFKAENVTGNQPFDLMLRIPGWAKGVLVKVNGMCVTSKIEAGKYFELTGLLPQNLMIELELPMQTRLTIANPMVEENSCMAAVERGPLVYCLEGCDNSVSALDEIYLDIAGKYSASDEIIAGRTVTCLTGDAYRIVRDNYDPEQLYQTLGAVHYSRIQVKLIPYFAWDNRGIGEMRVWMPYR